MALRIYNTLTRTKEDFKPVSDKKVRMYVCGPTVYNYISIGNARPVIVFNMVRNYLKHSGYDVEFVQNITDIEDKIIKKANDEDVDFNTITSRYIEAFLEDMDSLEIKDFTAMPKASEMIPEIISIIEKIIENGYGYISAGDVYFDVAKFEGYGKLSRQRPDEMKNQESDAFSKRNAIDFTLWKSAKPGEPYWESPWGKGRPGWHIECSAMSIKYLDYKLDIHGGGIDLVFPHHENEIAQSEAAFPEKGDFVKYWMHNGMIEVKEEKMSKSRGLKSDWILKNLLKKYSPDVIKMYILSTHYRSPLEFSAEKLKEAKKALEKIINFLRNVDFLCNIDKEVKDNQEDIFGETEDKKQQEDVSLQVYDYIKHFSREFKAAMDDDFNSARAIGILFDFIGNINAIIQNAGFKMNASIGKNLMTVNSIVLDYAGILGLNLKKHIYGLQLKKDDSTGGNYPDDEEIEKLISKRLYAREQKDFAKADEIREKLKSYGIILEDRKEGTIWKREK
ncbi:MAG: cysteine--tRNA ligase [Actinobacteria bacterium]|nr:cysteine--tRNA ligase [Actinomycetota bacterium]